MGLLVSLAILITVGCRHAHPDGDSDSRAPENAGSPSSDRWRLPIILGGTASEANLNAWYRLAAEQQLIGKPMQAAERAYGDQYVILRDRERGLRLLYYRLAGDEFWGMWGVVEVDASRTIVRVTTDPGS
jgi:hypothetical protein